jgi:Family of unknown function (DUF6084)
MLEFAVSGAAIAEAATPTIALDLVIERTAGEPVRAVLLNVQVRIAAPRRPYDDATKERLAGLFGAPEQWGRSLRGLLWTQTTLTVPAFDATTTAAVLLPCTYDLDVASAKYLDGVRDGVIPLELLFSGTVFHAGADGRLRTEQISWDAEAEHALPVALWHEAMERFYAGRRWLRLGSDAFDRLAAFRAQEAYATWDDAVDALLAGGGGV